MKKNCILLFFLIVILSLSLNSSAQETRNEIIAKINSEDVLKSKFDRLLNSQKKKLIDQLINETLFLQEAKAKNINVSEEEITKRLTLIKEKQGGEEGFNKFLTENNATLEDAKNEIKNQILIQLVKKQINNLNAFLNMKKAQSNIIIYMDKIFAKEQAALSETTADSGNGVMAGLAPVLMEDTNIRSKEYIVEEQPQEENKIFIPDIKEDTIIEPINVAGKIQKKNLQIENETLIPGTPLAASAEKDLSQDQAAQIDLQNRMEHSSKSLQELRRKIEQRRITNR